MFTAEKFLVRLKQSSCLFTLIGFVTLWPPNTNKLFKSFFRKKQLNHQQK